MQLVNVNHPDNCQTNPADHTTLKIQHDNLILERGAPLKSTLREEIQKTLTDLQFTPRDVLLSVLDQNGKPQVTWRFYNAIPVGWEIMGFDAEKDGVLIERIEMQYERVKPFEF